MDSAASFRTLCQWMAGEFGNQRQSMAEPANYAHIRVAFRPLPLDFFNGIGFYSEQAYDYDLWTPYRQGIHRVLLQADGTIYIENYALKEPMLYAGASREDSILASIPREGIERRCHCSMMFSPQLQQPEFSRLPADSDLPGAEGDRLRYVGQVEPGQGCIIPRGERQTYLVSEVDLTERTWVSRDRGFDIQTHEHVWGSALGPLRFDKLRSFAQELQFPTAL
jgi:CpeT protein